MKINIIPNDQETRVCLIGELDTTVTTTQVEDLNQVLALADKALEIDCEELEYISSAGLRSISLLPACDSSCNSNVSPNRKAVRFASPTSMRT